MNRVHILGMYCTFPFSAVTVPVCMLFNSLWPSDTIWWHRSGSTLAQVMACCHQAPSHYLIQCWQQGPVTFIWETPQPSIIRIRLKIPFPKFNWSHPGANKLTHCGLVTLVCCKTRSSLVWLMACCLFSNKPLYLNQCWHNFNRAVRKKLIYNRNKIFFWKKKLIKNVACRLSTILLMSQCAKLKFNSPGTHRALCGIKVLHSQYCIIHSCQIQGTF